MNPLRLPRIWPVTPAANATLMGRSRVAIAAIGDLACESHGTVRVRQRRISRRSNPPGELTIRVTLSAAPQFAVRFQSEVHSRV